MTAKDKQTAIENVKKGFNPFGNMLNKIRTQATIKKEDEGDDMMDKDFQQMIMRKNEINKITQIDMKAITNNNIEEQTHRYQKLTKIARKPKPNQTYEPFESPYIKIDVGLYKKKKRKELLATHDKSKLINYEQYLDENSDSETDSEDDIDEFDDEAKNYHQSNKKNSS